MAGEMFGLMYLYGWRKWSPKLFPKDDSYCRKSVDTPLIIGGRGAKKLQPIAKQEQILLLLETLLRR